MILFAKYVSNVYSTKTAWKAFSGAQLWDFLLILFHIIEFWVLSAFYNLYSFNDFIDKWSDWIFMLENSNFRNENEPIGLYNSFYVFLWNAIHLEDHCVQIFIFHINAHNSVTISPFLCLVLRQITLFIKATLSTN